MKRIVAIILILVVLLPVSSFAVPPKDRTNEIRTFLLSLSSDELIVANGFINDFLLQWKGQTAFDSTLSTMSYDELLSLKQKINLLMCSCEEWQEVTVPIGMWVIGEDIPAGKWNISVSPDANRKWGEFTYCDLLDASGIKPGNMFSCDIYVNQVLNRKDADDGEYPVSIDIELKAGNYFYIEKTPLVFTPPQGKPDLGFK